MLPTALALLPLLVQTPGEPLGPTPPPNRFDAEHDARLAREWERRRAVSAPLQQAPPLRPKLWRVAEGAGRERTRELVVQCIVLRRPLEGGRVVESGPELELAPFALAATTVRVDEEQVRFVRAPGVETVFVNGEGFVGDPERRGDLGVPVLLRAGDNELLLAGFGGGVLDVELWSPVTPLVMASWSLEIPESAPNGHGPWPNSASGLRIPIFNACPRQLGNVAFTYGHASRAHRLLPLRLRAPAPKRPGDRSSSWVTRPSGGAVLVYDDLGPPEEARTSLAVARYCQQQLLYRTGVVVRLWPGSFVPPSDADAPSAETQIVSVACTPDTPPGELAVSYEGRSRFALRAPDATTLRLAYAVDPLFEESVGPASRWRADEVGDEPVNERVPSGAEEPEPK